MNINEYIGFCLVRKGWSEAELARRTGQTPQNFHNKSARGSFKSSDLEKIAEAFGCDLEIKFVDKETGKALV